MSRNGLNIKLKKTTGTPYYVQIENQIISAIRAESLLKNDRLPPERELADMLGVSRKTVSRAYGNLVEQGVLSCEQGRGTFVLERPADQGHSGALEEMEAHMISAIELALQSGIDEKSLLRTFTRVVHRQYKNVKRIDAVFIECNVEQARSFSKQLESASGKTIHPYTLSEIEAMDPRAQKQIAQAGMVITTFNHMGTVKELLQYLKIDKRVIGVAITPNLESLIRIAKYPASKKIGLISLSEEFFFSVRSALKMAGLDHVEMAFTTTYDPKSIVAFVQDLDVLVVSPGRMEDVVKTISKPVDIIEFEYQLDQGSLEVVLSKLTDSND